MTEAFRDIAFIVGVAAVVALAFFNIGRNYERTHFCASGQVLYPQLNEDRSVDYHCTTIDLLTGGG